ncbi:hypothetical protein CDEST_14827 [Colletotrichum destructivum]|uniref:Uncharacterized protein n=1 Tax=Colletotrichum destructivum TaxID=34406 RepID=A0AAX4J322_9PEZI|nr:hypothetical protein CDEST_14827 [Colletotrichum destructivum]
MRLKGSLSSSSQTLSRLGPETSGWPSRMRSSPSTCLGKTDAQPTTPTALKTVQSQVVLWGRGVSLFSSFAPRCVVRPAFMPGPDSLTVLGASACSTDVSGQLRGVERDSAETVDKWKLSPMLAGRENWQLSRPSLSPRLDSPFLGHRRHDIAPGLWQAVEGKPPHVKEAYIEHLEAAQVADAQFTSRVWLSVAVPRGLRRDQQGRMDSLARLVSLLMFSPMISLRLSLTYNDIRQENLHPKTQNGPPRDRQSSSMLQPPPQP